MMRYLKWSFHEIRLLYFQPSQFKRNVEVFSTTWQARFRYILRLLPTILAFAIGCNLFCGHVYEMLGGHYIWWMSWVGMIMGISLSMGLGVVASIAPSVSLMIVMGLPLSMALGIQNTIMKDIAYCVALGVEIGFGWSVMRGVSMNLERGVVSGIIVGLVCDLFLGIVGSSKYGITRGLVTSLTFGVVYFFSYFRLYAYPIDFCWSVFAWLHRGRHLRRAWNICPVARNEVIWLPLPYLGRLLALLAQEDREEGFRQVAFVVAERPLQRRVALAALEEVALSDMKADMLATIERTPERLRWVGNASVSLPEIFSKVWSRFERVSQDVGQYRAMNNAFRKGEALQHAVQEIESIQTTLIGERSRFATRLLQTANSWRDLLEQEQKAWKTQLDAVREIPNPFVFGSAVPESERKSFVGRQDVVAQIERSILGGAHTPTLLLHGPRRMGKTSILNQLPRLLGSEFAPLAMDCQNPAVRESPATLLRYISRTLSDGLRRRNVTIEPLTTTALAQEPYGTFDDWLNNLEKAMPSDMRALLCLDEYERLQEIVEAGWGTTFLDALRHTLQHRPRIVLMFTGARTFAEMGPVWTDRFISARRMKVSFLSPEDVRPLLTQPIPEFDMTYADDALETLLQCTNGQPFLTQAVAYELVEHMNKHQRKRATCADVEAAITASFESGEAYFANIWTDEGPEEQAILRAVAHVETVPDHPQALARLQDHDLLTTEGVFAVPMVERWVRENQ